MHDDKLFLTYNQQMKRLRNEKNIICEGSNHKRVLMRTGYFNLVNGYKSPFVNSTDASGKHSYIPGTSVSQFQAVKRFDDDLRSFLLKYISQIEEELKTLTGYQFDFCNEKGRIPWYDISAYDPSKSLQQRMATISKAYEEMGRSRLDYVKFYMENHEQLPTWIVIKAVNLSTFIDILENSKKQVPHAICELYGLLDSSGRPNVKLLIGSLHWMRKIRNSCAHNERVYCISKNGGRIIEQYFDSLRPSYKRNLNQKVFDLVVYFKYYLPKGEYKRFIRQLKDMLSDLRNQIHPNAFDNVRGSMGLKDIDDLDALLSLPKDDIEYNRFDRQK